uniref:Hydroxyisourate hydrolase n=1 Tax=Kalanchoe fedtschenkoi TaxID=63787 RepID=A0A7N0TIP1_KALFE
MTGAGSIKVDVNGWLEAFAAHPAIGQTASSSGQGSKIGAQWSRGEQSTALATATDSTLQELLEWNARYREKFGFVFLICASGRSSPEILAELKKRFSNRPIVEFEIAAQEQMKVTELRLLKLIQTNSLSPSTAAPHPTPDVKKMEDRVTIIGGHLAGASDAAAKKASQAARPPITTHVLDVAKGCPAAGVDVRLEMWMGNHPYPSFEGSAADGWVLQGYSVTDTDGRSGQLMGKADSVKPGVYRISFNTGKYCSNGFFPYVSILFEIKESQKFEHFHVPLLFSPFSFTTYRGS